MTRLVFEGPSVCILKHFGSALHENSYLLPSPTEKVKVTTKEGKKQHFSQNDLSDESTDISPSTAPSYSMLDTVESHNSTLDN